MVYDDNDNANNSAVMITIIVILFVGLTISVIMNVLLYQKMKR